MAKSKKRSTPGISRIDQDHKHNHGFFVRLQRKGTTHSAFFSDKKVGGKDKALALAKAHYQKLLAKYGPARKSAKVKSVRAKTPVRKPKARRS